MTTKKAESKKKSPRAIAEKAQDDNLKRGCFVCVNAFAFIFNDDRVLLECRALPPKTGISNLSAEKIRNANLAGFSLTVKGQWCASHFKRAGEKEIKEREKLEASLNIED